MSTIDLSRLPAPDVVEVIDFETIYTERKAAFVALYPAGKQAEVLATLALESEPLAKLLQENAYREMVWRQRLNDAARAVMLAYARRTDLDQLAANVQLTRLVISPADATTSPPTPAVMEEDPSLRERVQLAYEGLSVAGPRNAYIKHARDADGRVADATAISPQPCDALVTVLAVAGDGTAPADLVAIVDKYLSDEDRRPVGDRLTVQGAEIVNYTIAATLFFNSAGPESELALQAAQARVDAYRSERRRLGRSVNRSAIIAALHVEGVERVDLDEPAADIPLTKEQAAYCTGVAIANGGAIV